jgi:hypothetical protein
MTRVEDRASGIGRFRILLLGMLSAMLLLEGCGRAADRLRGVSDTCACHAGSP